MRRSKVNLIEIILEICREPSGKTKIIYQANLNSNNSTHYISRLVKSGLLEASDTLPVLYKTTPKGLDFLNRMESIKAQIGNNKH